MYLSSFHEIYTIIKPIKVNTITFAKNFDKILCSINTGESIPFSYNCSYW